jgi:hypothetical protein
MTVLQAVTASKKIIMTPEQTCFYVKKHKKTLFFIFYTTFAPENSLIGLNYFGVNEIFPS